MPLEIERKYKLDRFPENLPELTRAAVEQGYLCTRPTVRIRSTVSYTHLDVYKRQVQLRFGDDVVGAVVHAAVDIPQQRRDVFELHGRPQQIDQQDARHVQLAVPLVDRIGYPSALYPCLLYTSRCV